MSSTLKTRSITGIALVAITVGCILLNKYTAGLLISVITLFSVIEYGFITRNNVRDAGFNGTFAAGFLPLVLAIVKNDLIEPYIYIGLWISMGVVFLFSALRFFFNIHFDYKNLGSLFGLFYIGIPMASVICFLVGGDQFYWEFLLSIFIFLWVSDTGAYLVGSRFGKHKLMPSISPGKTIEGSIGAGLITLLTAYILSLVFTDWRLNIWILIGVVVWILGTWGDLFESSIKRHFNIKDSSNYLPGHGGFLDRFDSFLIACPSIILLLKVLHTI